MRDGPSVGGGEVVDDEGGDEDEEGEGDEGEGDDDDDDDDVEYGRGGRGCKVEKEEEGKGEGRDAVVDDEEIIAELNGGGKDEGIEGIECCC